MQEKNIHRQFELFVLQACVCIQAAKSNGRLESFVTTGMVAELLNLPWLSTSDIQIMRTSCSSRRKNILTVVSDTPRHKMRF